MAIRDTVETHSAFGPAALAIDLAATAATVEAAIRSQVFHQLHRKGAVVGLSGGIDSSVVAMLCARALGPDRVLGLMLPELASADESLELATALADAAEIGRLIVPITPMLEAAGCYRLQVEAARLVIPEFDDGWKMKIVLPRLLGSNRLNVFSLVAVSPSGEVREARLSLDAYLQLVAATNMKQRVRKQTEYYHADRLRYAVAGTPNRLEYDQGFFVKNGDGAADFKPIAHLYKSQVYALAEHIGVPAAICSRPPTTDTYSLPQSQEEFFFSLPYGHLDLCLYGKDHGVPAGMVAEALALTEEQVEWVYADIDAKRRTALYLRAEPLLVEPVGHAAMPELVFTAHATK